MLVAGELLVGWLCVTCCVDGCDAGQHAVCRERDWEA